MLNVNFQLPLMVRKKQSPGCVPRNGSPKDFKENSNDNACDGLFFCKVVYQRKNFKKWCPWSEFAQSRVMRAKRASVVYMSTCKVLTCQSPANYSTWRANVPKAWQLFNLACLACQGVPIFQLGASTCQNGCQFFDFTCQNVYQFFNYFSF